MWKCLTCQTIMPSLAINNCTVCNTDKVHGESLIIWAKDWPCLNCGKNNFRQNIKCFYCSAFVNKKRAPEPNQVSGKRHKLNDSEDDDVMIIREVIDLDCTDDAGPSSSVDVEVVYVSSGCESDSDSLPDLSDIFAKDNSDQEL